MKNLVSDVTHFFRLHGFRTIFLLWTEAERRLSAKLIGIPAGFLEQLHGNLVRSYFAMIAPVPKNLKSRGREIRKNGLEVLEKSIDIGAIDKIYSLFEHRVATSHLAINKTFVAGNVVSEAIEFGFADPDLPVVQTVMTEQVVDALRATMGTNFQVVSYTVWRNFALTDGGQQDVYSNRWHVDGARTDEYKLFVFMQDVTPEHGGTIIANRVDTREVCRAGYLSRKHYAGAESMLKVLDERSSIAGPKGYAYIFTPNLCLHRAGVPKPGLSRTVLMVRVLPHRCLDLNPRRDEHMSKLGRVIKKFTSYLGHNDP